MNKTIANRYINAIKKNKSKYITVDMLSHELGYYSEAIAKDLAEFEPMLIFDPTIDLKDVLKKLEHYVESLDKINKKVVKKKVILPNKSELTYQQYILNKMTLPGGLIDKNISLTEQELKTLRRLINLEINRIKDSK